MPTYEYECKSCGHISDVFHSMTAKRRVKCSECGRPTKKLIGAGAGIIFKGSGFYETDYKRKSGPNGDGAKANGTDYKGKSGSNGGEAEAKTSENTSSESKTEKKSESKEAAKAENSS